MPKKIFKSLREWCIENKREDLLEEWDYEKNGELGYTPNSIGYGSHKKVWWKCRKEHSWQTAISVRTRGLNCPYCSNQKILVGYNDLETWCKNNHRECLIEEFDYDKNFPLTLKDFTYSSDKFVYWKCKCGYSWKTQVKVRAKMGCNCPKCGKLQKGVNDLETWCKQNNKEYILTEWDCEKNININPTDISYGATTNIWWKCKNNHSFMLKPNDRTVRKLSCPYCSNSKVLTGFNDLETWCKKNNKENILNEWDFAENDKFNITPQTISFGSSKEAYWICPKGHKYKMKISTRTCKNSGCSICSGHKILVGYNDLKTYSEKEGLEHLIDEWNDKRKITEFTKASEYKAKWKCRFCDYEWEARICNRTNINVGRTNCPKCNNQTSFAEQAVLYYAKKFFPDTINRYSDLGFELDVYIPSIKTAIEYDGLNYHKNKQQAEEQKNAQCIHNSINLIRIREEGLCAYKDCICFFRKNSRDIKNLDNVLREVFNHLGVSDFNIDIALDYGKILQNYKSLLIENSLATKFPEIAKEWHPTKNGKSKAENFNYGSSHMIWWQCKKGHEWQAIISSRTGKSKSGCPYCGNKKVLKGYNDLETYCEKNNLEHVLAEWDYEKNNKLNIKPNDIVYSSTKRVWWKCECGHEWSISIGNRTGKQQSNCPVCAVEKSKVTKNRNFLEKQGSLAQNNPELLLEWNYDKNKGVDPENIICGTPKRVWWKCKTCGFEWQTAIRKRAIEKTGCPSCNGNKLHIGFTDLETYCKNNNLYYLLNEWDYKKNILTPKDVTAHSHEKVWWLCTDCGCSFQSLVSTRTNTRTNGKGCPCCANKVVMQGFNDFKTLCQQNKKEYLLKEWNYEKNVSIGITPENIAFGSQKRVWWQCEYGHEWQTSVSNRTNSKGTNCPYCANRKLLVGYNDFETWCQNNNYSILLLEYNCDKNALLPNEVLYCSHTKFWFKCKECGYEWQTQLTNRTNNNKKTGCPKCGNTIPKKVKCIETNIIYNSAIEAEKQTKISKTCICNVCKGKQKTAGSYHWEYVDKENIQEKEE